MQSYIKVFFPYLHTIVNSLVCDAVNTVPKEMSL
jgi:hypothetical protein